MIVNNSSNINKQKRKFKQWLSTIPPISTNKKESLNNDCQRFHQYQQQQQKRMFKQWFSTIPPISTTNKESLNNDCQQFLQYQQTKKNV
jgi:mevalonate pyrophosphate decarboxylase